MNKCWTSKRQWWFYFVFPFKRPLGTLTLIISPSSFKIQYLTVIWAWSLQYSCCSPQRIVVNVHWKSQQLLVSTMKPLGLDGRSWQASTRHLAELDSVAFWSSKFEVPINRVAVMTTWAMKKKPTCLEVHRGLIKLPSYNKDHKFSWAEMTNWLWCES